MCEENKIQAKDLQDGDVLLFSAIEEDLLSEIIARLTDSPVSHSAMSYYKKEEGDAIYVVEENFPGGAQITDINVEGHSRSNRKTYVMRYRSDDLDNTADLFDGDKVIEVADNYVAMHKPYSITALPFIGFYLIVKDLTSTLELQKLIASLMRIAMGMRIENINKKISEDDPMDCSQFVYHCYREAGFRIILKNQVGQNIIGKVLAYMKENKDKLTDKINNIDSVLFAKVDSTISENIILEKLYHEIQEIKTKSKEAAPLTEDFVLTVYQFCKIFNFMYQPIEAKQEKNQSIDITDGIEKLIEMEEYFITPADLMNSYSLECVGILDYGEPDESSIL